MESRKPKPPSHPHPSSAPETPEGKNTQSHAMSLRSTEGGSAIGKDPVDLVSEDRVPPRNTSDPSRWSPPLPQEIIDYVAGFPPEVLAKVHSTDRFGFIASVDVGPETYVSDADAPCYAPTPQEACAKLKAWLLDDLAGGGTLGKRWYQPHWDSYAIRYRLGKHWENKQADLIQNPMMDERLEQMPGRDMSSEAAPYVERLLHDEDPKARADAALALSKIGDVASVPALIQVLGNTNEEEPVRTWAAIALGELGKLEGAPTGPALVNALKDSNFNVRSAAAHGLGCMGNVKAIAVLMTMLQHEKEARVRESVAGALGHIPDPTHTAVPELMLALKDEDWGVRQEAAKSLRAFRDTRAAPALREALGDPHPNVREFAGQALEYTQSRPELPLVKRLATGKQLIFVGWALDPAQGRWIDCTHGPEGIRAGIEQIEKAPRPLDAQELIVADHEGFHSLAELIRMDDPEAIANMANWIHEQDEDTLEALNAWVQRRGSATCARREFDTLLEQFQEDFCGIHESEADFAEEQWKEGADPDLLKILPDEILENVDWEKVWRGWETTSHWSADTQQGVAIFRFR